MLVGNVLKPESYENLTKQPNWDDELDYEKIEFQLLCYEIISLLDMRGYLRSQNKRASYTNAVYLVTLKNGLKAVFKPESNCQNPYAEVAAYKASKLLGLKLVPPTVIRSHNNIYGSLQFFVESPFDLINNDQNKKARSILTLQEINDTYLFYFIFGHADINNRGNQIIAFNNKAKIALVDNSSISTAIPIFYEDHAFVNWFEGNAFWALFYRISKPMDFPYKITYNTATLEKYKLLKLELLKEIFQDAIENKVAFCTEELPK